MYGGICMKTYFDKKTDEIKSYWYKRCEKLLRKCEKLENEADKLYEKAEEYLSNGNELEWEEALKEAIEKENHALGIKEALKELGFFLE
mgnify:FL=1